jgi:pilus assembly protein FimV
LPASAVRGVVMVAKSVTRAVALLLAFPPAVMALGLGDIRLNSSLNSPLDAEIELIGATPEELANLKANIASRETFARYGLEWPSYLSTVSLRSTRTSDGRDVIKLKSTETMTEPFVTLLVEVDWVRGRLVREYTMLLDPPVFTPGQERVANAPVAAPTTEEDSRAGAIERASGDGVDINAAKAALANSAASPPTPAPAVAPPTPSVPEPPREIDINAAKAALNGGAAPTGLVDDDEPAGGTAEPPRAPASMAAPPPPPVSSVSSPSNGDSAAGDSYRVERGDTLAGIANRYSNGNADVAKRWMVATYQNNPSAFAGNMNIMRQGSVLRMPDEASMAAINTSDAAAEIGRQYAAWTSSVAAQGTAANQPGRLRLVTPNSPSSVGTGDSPQVVQQLQGRVQELQSQLDESRRLLELRNAELAQLQSKLSQQGRQPEQSAPPAETPRDSQPAAQTPAEAPVAAAEPAEPAARPEPVRPPAAESEVVTDEGGSILDTLKGYWWLIALLAVLVLGYFGFKSWRSRQDAEFDDSLGRLAAAGADSLAREPRFDTSPAVMPSGRGEGAFLVEETAERPRLDTGSSSAPAPRNITSDDTISSDTAINLDQGDPLAEADFHMAYGLYDQAADLVRIAINREPDRRDLKLKLLEVFFVWGNREQFLQTARELADTRSQASPGEWEKIVIMGKQLAPEDPLFAGGSGLGAAASGGVDLDLEGGQSRVDFDLLGEPLPQEAGGVDLDIGTALGEPEPTMEQTARSKTDRNLSLDDEFLGEDEIVGGTTRQMTQKMPKNNDDDLLGDFGPNEGPTVEQPAYRTQDPTIRQKVAMAMRQNGARADQTAELALDDLGLDLGALDNDSASPDAPTMVAGLDERSRRIMESAEYRGGNGAGASETPGSGSWGFESDEFDDSATATAGRGQYTNGDAGSTSRLAALKGNDLDFDIGDLGDEQAASASNGRLDLDVGAMGMPDAGFTATQRLSSNDLALPDMEPVTMSEVGTKLDLARAYMDMGDPEGARNILEEVMQEGSVAQKQEAQRLIESLPG